MKFYIQKEGNNYTYDFQWSAYETIHYENYGRTMPKYELFHIDYKTLENSDVDKTGIYIGTIEFMLLVFKKFGINAPNPMNIPEQILSYADRKVWTGKKSDIKIPCFIKPASELKLFTGFLLEKNLDLSLYFPEIKDDTELLFSEPKRFISEWRGFVHKNELVDIKHYTGDWKQFPDIKVIEECAKNYTNSPVAYTLDFGITDEGKTILVECNDFWSTGLYGFTGDTLLKMFSDRFREITL